MTVLITESDIAAYKAISANINATKKLFPYVIEAQQFDLKELIGDAFYLDLVNDFNGSPSLSVYSDLWNGCEWTYAGITYRHEGLKSVLVYFSYARYAMNANEEETAFGIVNKTDQYSSRVSEKTILRKVDSARAGAMAYFTDVKKFLNDNSTDYPLWVRCCKKDTGNIIVTGVEPQDNHHKRYHRRWR